MTPVDCNESNTVLNDAPRGISTALSEEKEIVFDAKKTRYDDDSTRTRMTVRPICHHRSRRNESMEDELGNGLRNSSVVDDRA
jgi:hypothetical protein